VRPARDSWVNPALALLLCTVAGAVFAWLRIPLPWMSGPLLAMAACNFAGARLRSPPGGRALGQIVIGTALGLYFTPAVGREVTEHWWVLILAALVAIFLGVLGGWVLSRASGVDARTAFFASVPGGAAEMAILGERFHARVDRIALAQSLRVLIVVIAVPFALTYSGAHGTQPDAAVAAPVRFEGMALLLALGAAAAWLLNALRMPNAFFFGPLAAAIVLTLSDVQLSALPTAFTNPAQMLLGCALGGRFERRSLESAPRYVLAVFASVLVAMLASAGFGWVIGTLAGLPVPGMVLAMAPGGIAEMCITAKVLQLSVPLVTAAHVVRVLVLIVTTGPAFRTAQAVKARLRNG
jgi:membrane AbrB-like protein